MLPTSREAAKVEGAEGFSVAVVKVDHFRGEAQTFLFRDEEPFDCIHLEMAGGMSGLVHARLWRQIGNGRADKGGNGGGGGGDFGFGRCFHCVVWLRGKNEGFQGRSQILFYRDFARSRR